MATHPQEQEGHARRATEQPCDPKEALEKALALCLGSHGKPDTAALESAEDDFNRRLARSLIVAAKAELHERGSCILDTCDHKRLASFTQKGLIESDDDQAVIDTIARRARDPRCQLRAQTCTNYVEDASDKERAGAYAPWIVVCAAALAGHSWRDGEAAPDRNAGRGCLCAPVDARRCAAVMVLGRYLVQTAERRARENATIESGCGALLATNPVAALLGGFVVLLERIHATPAIREALQMAESEGVTRPPRDGS
ncbi:hypothetical protein pneo_cds_398 [Pandoravirus neocaledonia]|uniref:Uncharacterized protein n=1 Tax=Pandoravirus neocaledonia TaxID=2107708 RepID=A0A2U7UCC6_9VIRU|nr:hypothetical protein pneo_cds_398 [Pandoravirus neocaledonia]AVK76005.1 hypothetical protein pneo_cds_398 [Pandoravirus neocaledonia]